MSLRLRLTLLYSALLGVVLLFFGTLIYGLVSLTLLRQIDNTLLDASNELISSLRVNLNGQYDLTRMTSVAEGETFIFQVWDDYGNLQIAKPASWQEAIDSVDLGKNEIVYSSTFIRNVHLRVISIPLRSILGSEGTLQVGMNLTLMDFTRSTLSLILIILTFITILLTAGATWLVTGRALAPLATMTHVATQITRADDLSRRIPLTTEPENEVGQVIQAFNETLTRLEKLFTSQQRFVADVSHELRTPLTVIKGNMALMRKMKKLDTEALVSMEQEVDRLTRLVGDLLLLAQAESRRMPLDIKCIELDKLLLEVFKQMRLLAGEKLKVVLSEIDQVQVMGDRDRLKQVFLNLAGNAIQYTPKEGEVSLALRKTEEQAMVIISDTGPGIPEEDLPHIFERFYRGDHSRARRNDESFGLGLSIAYWIVHNHGGVIDVSSQPGKGSTFCVRLPICTSNGEENSANKPASQ